MRSLVETLRAYFGLGREEDYEVAEYVLERREPDPNPRVATYDEPVEPEGVESEGDLPSGEYLLQEVKASGMAGDVVWRTELAFEED